MLNIFGDVIKRLYISQHKVINIDNGVAKLHYRITFWLLLACCALVCSRQYFGDHIRCIVDNYSLPSHVVNTYCFFTSTYTLYKASENRSLYAHPGVAPHSKGETIIHHTYYQWVPFVLFGQALLFHLPHLIWKSHEGGIIRDMAEGLQRMYLRSSKENTKQISGYTVYSAKTISNVADRLHNQFLTRSRFRLNRRWGSNLICFEIMNLINVLSQIYFMNSFLGSNFMDLGVRLMSNAPHDNPFEMVFPKVTKCDFHKYGASGSIQKYDAMCVMALNIVNEKIYAILWFWFAFLVPVSFVVLLWRIFSYTLHCRSERFNYYLLQWTSGIKLSPMDLAITRHFSYTDWLFLYYLSANIDAVVFREVLNRLGSDLNEQMPSTSSSDLEDEKKSVGHKNSANDVSNEESCVVDSENETKKDG